MIFLSLFFYDTSHIMSDSLALKFNISSLSAQRALALEDLGAIIGAVIAGPIGDNRGPRVVFFIFFNLLVKCLHVVFVLQQRYFYENWNVYLWNRCYWRT